MKQVRDTEAKCPSVKVGPLAKRQLLPLSVSAIDVLLGIDDVEEAIFLVLEPLKDLGDGGVMLHQVLAVSEQNDADMGVTRNLQLLLDDGHNLGDLEGVWHEELGIRHVAKLRKGVLILGTLDDQGELIGVLLPCLSSPLDALLYKLRQQVSNQSPWIN